MSVVVILLWIAGVTSFTFLGSIYARRCERVDLLVGLYVAFILTAQILATKLAKFDLGVEEFIVPAGVLVFSVTFLITDIVNEKWGRAETQRMILIAFFAQVAMSFFVWLATQFDSANVTASQVGTDHWNNIFTQIPRITIASWLAFLAAENLDAYLYAWLKRVTNDRHLWMRNVFSTLPALALDSLIFVPIAFLDLAHLEAEHFLFLLAIMKGQIIVKWLVGVFNVPFMYMNHAILLHKGNEISLRKRRPLAG